MLTIGILHEGKVPPDARAPLSPQQCTAAQEMFPVRICVQSSATRAFTDDEYRGAGLDVVDDISGADVLIGVKEVPVAELLPGKTYLFFSHTIKKQAYNRKLLQTILERRIRLIDYEVLTDDLGDRLVAFGFYAGLVGSHNGLWTYGRRTGAFTLPRLFEQQHYEDVLPVYAQLKLPPLKIVLAGSGRVATGVLRNLHDLGISGVSPRDFLHKSFDRPVFTQLFPQDYVRHKTPDAYFDKQHFYAHGDEYESVFHPFAHRADLFMNGIYYDKRSPMFFSREDMLHPNFSLQVVADISCDIYPDSAVPCTLRPSTIAEPVYGYDPGTGAETPPFQPPAVDVMAIDNLPSELPRDASVYFGRQLLDHVIPALVSNLHSPVLDRATIAEGGKLTPRFAYLSDWIS
ncbi:MAG: NAD(P)-dependent oxidoreductase [Saprospiraceae bacterium]|nr:NAD(P)-dependent oxidoreductase [Saprospiraceae bacterium]